MRRCKPVRASGNDALIGYRINCPGCESPHIIYTNLEGMPRWNFNGSLERPTFSPSLLVRAGHYVKGQPQPPNCIRCNEAAAAGEPTYCSVCHSFIRDGQIQFLNDCTHKLAGQTVDLPEPPDWND